MIGHGEALYLADLCGLASYTALPVSGPEQI